MIWIIPFEVNNNYTWGVQIPTYTCAWAGAKNMAAVAQHIANKGPFNVLSASFAAIQVAWRLNKVCLLPSKLKIMV